MVQSLLLFLTFFTLQKLHLDKKSQRSLACLGMRLQVIGHLISTLGGKRYYYIKLKHISGHYAKSYVVLTEEPLFSQVPCSQSNGWVSSTMLSGKAGLKKGIFIVTSPCCQTALWTRGYTTIHFFIVFQLFLCYS